MEKMTHLLGNGKDSSVRNNNLMCITSKIYEGVAKSVEGFFDKRVLVQRFFIKYT